MSLMPDVEIKKRELLMTLKDNLHAHEIELDDLLEERRLEIKNHFQTELDFMARKPDYQPKDIFSFPKPKDNSDSYTKAIRMVEMSIGETIKLTEHQFDQLVMDNWGWKQEFNLTSSLYKK